MVTAECLREHIRLLRELDGSLADSTEALAHSDIASVVRETERQQRIIQAVTALRVRASAISLATDHEKDSKPKAGVETNSLADSALEDFHRARAGVMAQNRIYSALLRRSRRTVDIFARLVLNAERSDGTYAF
jgi:hypothetical protein